MTQAQPTLDFNSAVTHTHLLHYSVTFLAVASILGALYYISQHRNRRSKYRVKLIEKTYITHDTAIFTFLLPPNRKSLGLKVGEHLEIEQPFILSCRAIVDGKIINRKYTPISRIDRKQTFQLLIKIYHKIQQFPEGGVMSQYLDSLPINQEIDISLPYGRFNYQKHGQVKINTLEQFLLQKSKKTWKKKYNNFFMVAGGTGITPLYQIIQYITEHELQVSPNLTLLFANRTEDDILLFNELKQYAEKNTKVKLFFSVDKSIKEGWKGMVGFVDEQKIATAMGNFSTDIENTVFLSCGPPILSNIVEKIWRTKYHVKAENMFRF